jgi:hypothetical protein
MDRRLVLVALVALHLVVAGTHGVTHSLVPVWLSPEASVLVLATTFLGPVVGVVLAWRSHPVGVPLLAVSMLGAFLTGGILHFVVATPDHVHAIPAGPWRIPFQASAVAVAATSALGTVASTWAWHERRGTNGEDSTSGVEGTNSEDSTNGVSETGGADAATERP